MHSRKTKLLNIFLAPINESDCLLLKYSTPSIFHNGKMIIIFISSLLLFLLKVWYKLSKVFCVIIFWELECLNEKLYHGNVIIYFRSYRYLSSPALQMLLPFLTSISQESNLIQLLFFYLGTYCKETRNLPKRDKHQRL